MEYVAADGTVAMDWMLHVLGKGGRMRQVPVPARLVQELSEELARNGCEAQVGAVSNQAVHVLARFDPQLEHPVAWSESGLYQAIKSFLAKEAEGPG